MVSIQEVKHFWEKHPLLSYEIKYEPGSQAFFRAYNPIRDQVEKFCFHLFEFDRFNDRKVLDVGCGNGWLLWNYARNGADTTGVDLTRNAVKISRKRFSYEGLSGKFMCADAGRLPLKNDQFDLVTSLGVIHHTPDTERCAREIIRVTRPGGRILVCLYYRNILLRPWSFPFVKLLMRMLKMNRSGNDPQGITDRITPTPDELVRTYDGPDNPLGKAYDKSQIIDMFSGLRDMKTEIHYFPLRFIPLLNSFTMPLVMERMLDRHLGIMLYLSGYKKE